MARLINCNAVNFKKVSGWQTGPLKPDTILNTTALDSQVINSVNSAISSLVPNMSEGETITIILTAGESVT